MKKLNDTQRMAAVLAVCLILLIACVLLAHLHTAPREFVIQLPPDTLPREQPMPLRGRIVIIDPGHGGLDPGSHGSIGGHVVFEAPYVNDVALRVARLVRERGGIPILTRSNDRITESQGQDLLSLARDDRFRDGSIVRGGVAGMESRLAVAHRAIAERSQRDVVFVSIHFDAEANDRRQGVFVIDPQGPDLPIAQSLIGEMRHDGRMLRIFDGTSWHPCEHLIIPNPRNVYVLRGDKNPVRERALVELGNFNNPGDLWRIRSPAVRELYATAIARAIMN